jgi:hypothetical protein
MLVTRDEIFKVDIIRYRTGMGIDKADPVVFCDEFAEFWDELELKQDVHIAELLRLIFLEFFNLRIAKSMKKVMNDMPGYAIVLAVYVPVAEYQNSHFISLKKAMLICDQASLSQQCVFEEALPAGEGLNDLVG